MHFERVFSLFAEYDIYLKAISAEFTDSSSFTAVNPAQITVCVLLCLLLQPLCKKKKHLNHIITALYNSKSYLLMRPFTSQLPDSTHTSTLLPKICKKSYLIQVLKKSNILRGGSTYQNKKKKNSINMGPEIHTFRVLNSCS